VQCCDRDEGEDCSGDPRYPPATLVFHSSSIAAVKATLEYKQTAALEDIKNAALRVARLKEMEPMIIEVRQVCFDLTLISAERCQTMHAVICKTLEARAQEILLSMCDLPETEGQIYWTKAMQNSAGCVEGLVEKVVNRVGQANMSNFEIKFFREEYAMEIVGYNEQINKLMPMVKDKVSPSWCEIHPFYPDQTEDARVVRFWSEKANKKTKRYNNNAGRK